MNAPTFNFVADAESLLKQEWLFRVKALDEISKTHGFRAGQDNHGNICVKRGNKIVGGTISARQDGYGSFDAF